MSTAATELSETWTLRRRSATHMTQHSPSYRFDLDVDREFQEVVPGAGSTVSIVPRHPSNLESTRDKRLTCRELQVIELVATGATDQEIADRLFISRRTVTSHMASILAKLGVGNRTAAAVHAARSGLIV